MCGRFTQIQSRDDYLAFLAEEAESDIAYDPEPIGRYNVATGTKVLLLNNREGIHHLDPVVWSYAPGWWDKAPLINARVETAASSRMYNRYGIMAGQLCLLMDGMSGRKEETKSSRTTFTGKTGNHYSLFR